MLKIRRYKTDCKKLLVNNATLGFLLPIWGIKKKIIKALVLTVGEMVLLFI